MRRVLYPAVGCLSAMLSAFAFGIAFYAGVAILVALSLSSTDTPSSGDQIAALALVWPLLIVMLVIIILAASGQA